MSFPKYMDDEELRTYGFVLCPDNENEAYCELYPNLSRRHRCSSCGMWSSVTGGKQLVCPQCSQRKNPIRVTKQYFKLYLCCHDDTCPTREQAFQILQQAGLDTHWRSHDRFGEYVSLELLMRCSDEERIEFFEIINDYSVSKFGARKLCHPNSKSRSKLPKRIARPK